MFDVPSGCGFGHKRKKKKKGRKNTGAIRSIYRLFIIKPVRGQCKDVE